MPTASGVAKKLRYKKETTWGTAAGASGAQILRRLTSDLNLTKQTYRSNELRADMQRADFRHGSRAVEGTINGEFSVGTYTDFIASALRQAWQTAATTGAVITVTAATTSGSAGTFTRSAGSYLTDGFKIGDVVRWTGWATTGVNNNSKNMLITALTATVMTVTTLDGTAVAAKTAGDSVTCTLAGKKTWIPTSGQTDESYTIEHWFDDIDQSEVFTGCKISQIDMNLPATGIAELNSTIMGKDMTTNTVEYFTSPTAANTGTALAAVNGALYVSGTKVANVTGMNLTLNGNFTSGEVIGSNTMPFIFQGSIDVSGQITAYFEDATLRDMFINETEATISVVMTASNSANAGFVGIMLPRVKFGGSSKDDGEKGLIQTLPFTALLKTDGGSGTAYDATTIAIQDSSVT